MGTSKHLELRASPHNALGMTITYIQNQPHSNQELAGTTLQARFLPFAVERDDPQFREIAIRCATECEAWAKAIREYAELAPSMNLSLLPQQGSHLNYVERDEEIDDVDDVDESLAEDPESQERKRRRREGNMGF